MGRRLLTPALAVSALGSDRAKNPFALMRSVVR